LANNNPDIDFVLIGWKWGRTDFSKIENYANVHFLGQKNYEELPQYINKFSVAIIPHKIDQFTKSMNPLKIYEYLAAGKQVVSTPVAGLELFENDIKVGNTKQEFNQHVLDLLKKNKSNKEGQNKFLNKFRKSAKPDEKKDLKSMVEENLRISKKIHRYIIWQRAFGVIKILIIVIPIIIGIIYLPTILQDILQPYQELLGGAQDLNNDIGGLLKEYGSSR